MAEGGRNRRVKWDSRILARMSTRVMATLIKIKNLKIYSFRGKKQAFITGFNRWDICLSIGYIHINTKDG